MTNTATRLITLLMMLQRQPNQKAADLAAELGVSIRSLHRYIGMLEEMGIPICSERGRHGGFSLVRGYRMPPLVFTPEEAVALYLGTSLVSEMWGALYETAARGALAKLENVLPDEQRHEVTWARRTLVATGMHRGEQQSLAALLEKLRRAVREQRRVTLHYRSRSRPAAEQRDVDPYALVHRWGWWYVIGYCHLRQAQRSFRVDRIAAASLGGDTFSPPADWDVHAYLAAEPQYQPAVQVKLSFSPELAFLAQDGRSFWELMQAEPDGSVTVTSAMPNIEAAAAMVLSYGPAVVVLAPPELRQRVQEWARQIADKYERPEGFWKPFGSGENQDPEA